MKLSSDCFFFFWENKREVLWLFMKIQGFKYWNIIRARVNSVLWFWFIGLCSWIALMSKECPYIRDSYHFSYFCYGIRTWKFDSILFPVLHLKSRKLWWSYWLKGSSSPCMFLPLYLVWAVKFRGLINSSVDCCTRNMLFKS